jgi:hypothetical protein
MTITTNGIQTSPSHANEFCFYFLNLIMAKVELFNIEDKKNSQRKAEMAMTPSERLLLCLDLMDLHSKLHDPAQALPDDDGINWIELPLKKK